jgi:hypothetical protein
VPTSTSTATTGRRRSSTYCSAAGSAGSSDLPAIRLTSRALRYDEAELDAWLDEHATAAPGRESASNPDRRRRRNAILPVPAIPLPSAARDEED